MLTGREWFWSDYLASVQQVLAAGPKVLDVGTPVPFRKELARVPIPDPAPRVWTLDYPGSNRADVSVFGDAARLPFRDGEFDGVICKEVLEHVKDPLASARELVRVTRPGGSVFVTLIFVHPYHAASYGDYWRFTEDAARELFRGLDLRIGRAGGWPFIFRAYSRGLAHRALMSRAGTSVLNWLDRAVPAGHATLFLYVVGIRR